MAGYGAASRITECCVVQKCGELIDELILYMNARAQRGDEQSAETEDRAKAGFSQETTGAVKDAEFKRPRKIFLKCSSMMIWFLCVEIDYQELIECFA
jgi:hypothetical protein